MNSNPIMSSLKDISMGDHSSLIVSEKDLLDMNITDTSTEKITENVDDIVQDLENLLGEPTTSFDFTIRPKDAKRNINLSQNKDITMDLDAFSAELQMFEGKPTDFYLFYLSNQYSGFLIAIEHNLKLHKVNSLRNKF
jgi:hypothetical protein